jgi:hypothetical protein
LARHKLVFEQDGAKLMGTHEDEFAAGDLSGVVAANTIRFQSSLASEGTRVSFQFSGTLEGDRLSGAVDRQPARVPHYSPRLTSLLNTTPKIAAI